MNSTHIFSYEVCEDCYMMETSCEPYDYFFHYYGSQGGVIADNHIWCLNQLRGFEDLTYMHTNGLGEADTFSTKACECCHTKLAGSRFLLEFIYSD